MRTLPAWPAAALQPPPAFPARRTARQQPAAVLPGWRWSRALSTAADPSAASHRVPAARLRA